METTLELWASSLREAKARLCPLFKQERVAASACLFLDGLLGPERRQPNQKLHHSLLKVEQHDQRAADHECHDQGREQQQRQVGSGGALQIDV